MKLRWLGCWEGRSGKGTVPAEKGVLHPPADSPAPEFSWEPSSQEVFLGEREGMVIAMGGERGGI